MNRALAFVLLLMLAGCDGLSLPDFAKTKDAASDTQRNSGARDTGGAQALEDAAMNSGIVVDPAKVSPIGLYTHRHEAGRDSLCIAPAGEGEMTFGMEAVFGESNRCIGRGKVRTAGDKLIFHFRRSTCLIIGIYDGDRVSLPGALDVNCADLCVDRASFEGVSFPRTSSDAAAARTARDRDGKSLCPSD